MLHVQAGKVGLLDATGLCLLKLVRLAGVESRGRNASLSVQIPAEVIGDIRKDQI